MKAVSSTIMILAAFALGAQAQTPAAADAQPTFKAGAEEVVLDVVVRDKKGKMINDLKASDFAVTDGGQARTIKNFRHVEGTEAVTSGGKRSQLDPLRQIRLLTLIFQGMDQQGNKLAREASAALLKSELGPNVYMSVVVIAHKLEIIQPFTNDLALLQTAVNRATSGSQDFTGDTTKVRAQLENLLGPNQGGDQSAAGRIASMSTGASGTSGAAAAPQGGSMANIAMAQMMLQIANASQDDSSTDWGRTIIMALLTAVKEQYRLPGRKTILYFSSGFTIPQGMEEAYKNVISIANRASVSFYPVDAGGLTTYSTASNASNALNDAAGASRNNALNAGRGVSTDMAQADDKRIDSGRSDWQMALAQLAKDTGGEFIANSNDFKGRVKKLNEDIQSYYEISYDPEISKYDGAFRTVSVKMSEPDLRVQSRLGYFALPPNMANTATGPAVMPYEMPLLKALDQSAEAPSFDFRAAAMHFQTNAAATADIVIDIPFSALTFKEDKATGQSAVRFAYVALIKDEKGEVVKKLHNEVPMKVPADKVEARKAGHFIAAEPFDLPAGKYTLETAVLDGEGEKVSTHKTSFTVPQPEGKLALSSVSVIRKTGPKAATTKPNDPMLMADNLVTPELNPVIKKSEMPGLPLYVVIYSNKASAEKPSLQLEFTMGGKSLGAFPAPIANADASGRIPDVVTIPTGSLPNGSYMVKLLAKQGAETATESINFTIEP